MNVAYEAFLPYVLPLVPHVPEPTAVIAIRNACIDFCRGSLFLEQTMDPISTAAGVADYEIDVPMGTVLTQVVSLYHQALPLVRRSVSELASMYGRDWQDLSGVPKSWVQLNPTEVKLVLTPDKSEANALTGIIAVTPSRSSTTVDEQVFERYVEPIAQGAASKMLGIPGQPFSNPEAALLYGRMFASAIANVRSLVNAGQNRAAMRIRFNKV